LPILAYKRITPATVHNKIKQCENDETNGYLLGCVNIGKIRPENITGGAPEIKKEKRSNDPERSMLINIHILLFLQKVIVIKATDDNNAYRHHTVGNIAVPAKTGADTFIQVQDTENPRKRYQPVGYFEIVTA